MSRSFSISFLVGLGAGTCVISTTQFPEQATSPTSRSTGTDRFALAAMSCKHEAALTKFLEAVEQCPEQFQEVIDRIRSREEAKQERARKKNHGTSAEQRVQHFFDKSPSDLWT